MAYIKSVNKKLDKAFDGRVRAREDSGRIVLSGKLERWEDVVRAGSMAVSRARYIGLINNIECTGERPSPPRMPSIRDDTLDGERPDVIVIGGGVIGCAIARELSRYKLDVLLVEKEHDLAMHTSSRNDGMIHPGIDLRKRTQKYRYNKLGNSMFEDVCTELDVEFKRSGQYICFDRRVRKPLLYLSLVYWKWLGLNATQVVGKKKLLKAEPKASQKAHKALYFPTAGVVCPYNLTIAYAENAVQNGARVSLDTAVLGIDSENGVIKSVTTNRGRVYPKIVVNAAGVFCEDIAKMAGDHFYSIHPRKGTNAILDKKYSDEIAQTIISSMATASTKKKHTKGGAIIRTVDGNILVGPDAVETIEKEDFSTTRMSVVETFYKQGRTCGAIEEKKIITYYTGIRACTYEEDFVVCKGKFVRNIVHAAGIQSPGLTAAPAIGVEVAHMAVRFLSDENAVERNMEFDPIRRIAPRTAKLDYAARAELIAQNPDYGSIICRCEEISKGEILDALRRSIPCDTIDGIKRRVRPGMGRCQGGFCGPLVLDIIAKEKGINHSGVTKSGGGSKLLFGATKM